MSTIITGEDFKDFALNYLGQEFGSIYVNDNHLLEVMRLLVTPNLQAHVQTFIDHANFKLDPNKTFLPGVIETLDHKKNININISPRAIEITYFSEKERNSEKYSGAELHNLPHSWGCSISSNWRPGVVYEFTIWKNKQARINKQLLYKFAYLGLLSDIEIKEADNKIAA